MMPFCTRKNCQDHFPHPSFSDLSGNFANICEQNNSDRKPVVLLQPETALPQQY